LKNRKRNEKTKHYLTRVLFFFAFLFWFLTSKIF
jgi:hypothetical protein